MAADVGDPAIPQRLVDAALERFGALHILVANAGGPPPARALEVEDTGLDAALETNLKASIRLAKAAIPSMREAGWGRICFLTSWGVRQPIPTLAYSNVARTGLVAWAKTAAQDLVDDAITVNVLAPGLHATDRAKELGATGRLGDPEDFGRIVAFLCSDPASFVSGVTLSVAAGYDAQLRSFTGRRTLTLVGVAHFLYMPAEQRAVALPLATLQEMEGSNARDRVSRARTKYGVLGDQGPVEVARDRCDVAREVARKLDRQPCGFFFRHRQNQRSACGSGTHRRTHPRHSRFLAPPLEISDVRHRPRLARPRRPC